MSRYRTAIERSAISVEGSTVSNMVMTGGSVVTAVMEVGLGFGPPPDTAHKGGLQTNLPSKAITYRGELSPFAKSTPTACAADWLARTTRTSQGLGSDHLSDAFSAISANVRKVELSMATRVGGVERIVSATLFGVTVESVRGPACGAVVLFAVGWPAQAARRSKAETAINPTVRFIGLSSHEEPAQTAPGILRRGRFAVT